MRTYEMFLRVILANYLAMWILSCSCESASSCPSVRGSLMSTVDGVKCVCKNEFSGENCQLRADNAFSINAFRLNSNEVRVQWVTEAREQPPHIFTRKMWYTNTTRLPVYGKWRAGLESRDGVEEDPRASTRVLRLEATYSWEIRVVYGGDDSAMVFIDASSVDGFDLEQRNTTVSNNGSEECRGLKCSIERVISGFLGWFHDSDSPCFRKGVIVGCVIGVLANVVILAFGYFLMRCLRCLRQKTNKQPWELNLKPIPWFSENECSTKVNVEDIELRRSQSVAVWIKDDDNISIESRSNSATW